MKAENGSPPLTWRNCLIGAYSARELTKLLNYQRYTVPEWEGHRYLYRKNDGLQNQSVIYTQKAAER